VRTPRTLDTAGTLALAGAVTCWIVYVTTGSGGALVLFFVVSAAGIALEPLTRLARRSRRRNHPSQRRGKRAA